MKKLLALTAVIGSTVAIAGCNGIAESTKMFKDIAKSVDIESNLLKIELTKPTMLVDAPGYTYYNEKMIDTMVNTNVTLAFFDKMYETFDFGVLGKEQHKKISVEGTELDAKVNVKKLDSKNSAYSLEFNFSQIGMNTGGKINVEQVDGFMNVKMYQYMDLMSDNVIDFEYFSDFTKNSLKQVYFHSGDDDSDASYTYSTIESTSTDMQYASLNFSEAEGGSLAYNAGMMNKDHGSVLTGVDLQAPFVFGFNKNKTVNDENPFENEIKSLLTTGKMGATLFTDATFTSAATYLRSLIESM